MKGDEITLSLIRKGEEQTELEKPKFRKKGIQKIILIDLDQIPIRMTSE